MSRFQLKTSIKSYETDAHGKISLPNIFYYFQEAANLHATSLNWGMEYLESINKFWVLSRLCLKVKSYPEFKDEITIETWSRGAEGFFAYRDYRIWVAGKCCIDAASSWMILDRNTHRPTRIDQLERQIPGIGESYIPFPENKIASFDLNHQIFEKQIQYSDIDINHHVNNGKYIEIITDALTEKLMSGSVISELDIQYLYETRLGDTIVLYSHAPDNNTTILTMVNNIKVKETCRCCVRWKRKNL